MAGAPLPSSPEVITLGLQGPTSPLSHCTLVPPSGGAPGHKGSSCPALETVTGMPAVLLQMAVHIALFAVFSAQPKSYAS